MRRLLGHLLLCLLPAAAARAEPVGYAAGLPGCGNPDEIKGAVLVLDVTPATARCAVLMARAHPQVVLVAHSAAVGRKLAEFVSDQVLVVGPRFFALGVAEHLELVARALAEEAAPDGDEANVMRISPDESMSLAARRFSWRKF